LEKNNINIKENKYIKKNNILLKLKY